MKKLIISYILRLRVKPILLALIICSTLSILVVQLKNYIKITADTSTYPIIVWWTPFMYENKKLITCENKYQCIVSKNRSRDSNTAAYLFYGSNFNEYDLPLPKDNIPWAIFHEESPKNLAFFLHKEGQQLFNITSTFSRISDFPLTLQYLEDLNLITDTTHYYVPLQQKNKLLTKIAPVLYIQSDCETPVERDSYVAELMNYIPIDSYGSCLNNKKMPQGHTINKVLENLYDAEFMKFVAQYKFTIAIENSVCHDYITEKLWRPLMVGSIPIYLGSPTVKDWLPNNQSAILVSDYKNISDLADYIKYVNSNDSLYEKYMRHKLLNFGSKVTNDLLKNTLEKGYFGIHNNKDFPIPAFECFVCKTIHKETYKNREKLIYDCEEPKSRNTNKPNWWITHWKNGKCQAKTLQYFIETLKMSNYTKEVFEAQFNIYLQNKAC